MTKYRIRIDELMMGLQDHDYSNHHYFDTETGEVVFISDFLDVDEGLADLLEEERERFIEIDRVSSQEAWQIMDDFVGTVTNGRIHNQLATAISGKGAFRRFKDTLYDYPDIRQRWFIYEEKRYLELANDWAEMNELDIEITPFHPENIQPAFPKSDKKLLILFGPPAVGKMTVGREIAERTGLKLFHNHMTIELVIQFFDFGTPQFQRLVDTYRQMMMEEVAQSDLPGLIFTFVWALDHRSDDDFVEQMADIFRAHGSDVYYVELYADLDVRLERNKGESRLVEKPTKRNIAESEARLLEHDAKFKFNSDDEFEGKKNYFKLDNTNLSAAEAAEEIIAAFGW